MEPDEITGANFRVYRPAPGYVRCDFSGRADVSGQDARDILAAMAALADGDSTPVLADLRGARSGTQDMRAEFSQSRVPSRVALYVGTPLSRTLANFFITVARPSVPTKVFTDLQDAQDWLLDDG